MCVCVFVCVCVCVCVCVSVFPFLYLVGVLAFPLFFLSRFVLVTQFFKTISQIMSP